MSQPSRLKKHRIPLLDFLLGKTEMISQSAFAEKYVERASITLTQKALIKSIWIFLASTFTIVVTVSIVSIFPIFEPRARLLAGFICFTVGIIWVVALISMLQNQMHCIIAGRILSITARVETYDTLEEMEKQSKIFGDFIGTLAELLNQPAKLMAFIKAEVPKIKKVIS